MPITPFLTATGFVVTILLVWTQSWISIYKPEPLPMTVGLGLMWTYLTVVAAMATFFLAGLAGWKASFRKDFRVRGLPLGMLVSVLIMTVIEVGQSLILVAIKFWEGVPPDEVLPAVEALLKTSYGRYWAFGGIVISFVVIFLMSWLGIRKRRFWIAEGVLLAILAIGFVIWVSVTK